MMSPHSSARWAWKAVAILFVAVATLALAVQFPELTVRVGCLIAAWLYCGRYFVYRLLGKVAYLGAIAVYPSDSPLMKKVPDAGAIVVSLIALYGMWT